MLRDSKIQSLMALADPMLDAVPNQLDGYVPSFRERLGFKKYLKRVLKGQTDIELESWDRGSILVLAIELMAANRARRQQGKEITSRA